MRRFGPAALIESAAIAATLCAFASRSSAQGDYPVRTVRIIVPSSPAGGNDTVSRLIAQGLTERWRRQVVVDSRPGASTMIGGERAGCARRARRLHAADGRQFSGHQSGDV